MTLSDVASRAGTSVATASKALNSRAEVAPETRERVLRAAAELSFQPNVLARGLISGRTRTVGLLTDELGGRFAIPILLGAENALGNGQMSVLLCDARGDAIRRQHYIRTLLARQVDGFIVVGDSNDLRPSLTQDIPVPVVYAYAESTDPRDLSIVADDEGGARLAAEHLVSHGRRRIGHITGPDTYRAARDRVAGLRAVLAEAGLTPPATRSTASGRNGGAGTPPGYCSPPDLTWTRSSAATTRSPLAPPTPCATSVGESRTTWRSSDTTTGSSSPPTVDRP